MSKTNPFLSPPFDNTVTPGSSTVTNVAIASSSRRNQGSSSENATTTDNFRSIDSSFFGRPTSSAAAIRENNNEQTRTYEQVEDKLRSSTNFLPPLGRGPPGQWQQQHQQQHQQQQYQLALQQQQQQHQFALQQQQQQHASTVTAATSVSTVPIETNITSTTDGDQQHQENGSLVPSEKDVLCGRGGRKKNDHPGNINYRAVIQTNKAVFDQCRLNTEKRDVSIAIVTAIRAGGGRFLQPRKAEDTNKVEAGTTTWCEIGDPKAVEKTLQALREKRHDTYRQHEQQTIAAAGVDSQQQQNANAALQQQYQVGVQPQQQLQQQQYQLAQLQFQLQLQQLFLQQQQPQTTTIPTEQQQQQQQFQQQGVQRDTGRGAESEQQKHSNGGGNNNSAANGSSICGIGSTLPPLPAATATSGQQDLGYYWEDDEWKICRENSSSTTVVDEQPATATTTGQGEENSTTTTTTNNRSINNDDSDDSKDTEDDSLEQQQLQQQHSYYTTIRVQVPFEPLLPGNRMVIDLPANREDEEETVLFEITVPSNIEPGMIIPVQVPTQQPPTAETELEKRFRSKRQHIVSNLWGMLFSYYNKKYNPKFLYGIDFDESEFPIQVTDERVLDRFTQWVLDATHDQLTGLPFEGKFGGCVDHRHGVPKEGRISKNSRDGTFRCLCSRLTNVAIGVFENAIVANSNPDVDGTDAITPPYDITNDKNVTLFQNIRDLFYIINPQLREEWKTAPQAQTVRDEILIRNGKVRLRRNYLKRNKKTMTFNKGRWTDVEDDNLFEGISEKGWSNWDLISRDHVPTRSNDQVKNRAHHLLKTYCEEDKVQFNKGSWTDVEDDNLFEGISEKGWSNWILISRDHVPTRSNDQVKGRAHQLWKEYFEEDKVQDGDEEDTESKTANANASLDRTRPPIMYKVIFSTKRLGLGLKEEGGQIVVISTQHPTFVQTGDILISLANENVQHRSSDDIRRLLLSAQSRRPITLQFLRTKRQPHANRQRQQELHDNEVDVEEDEDDEDATGLNGNIVANRVSPAPIVNAPAAPVTNNPAAGGTAVPPPSPPRSRHHQQTYEYNLET